MSNSSSLGAWSISSRHSGYPCKVSIRWLQSCGRCPNRDDECSLTSGHQVVSALGPNGHHRSRYWWHSTGDNVNSFLHNYRRWWPRSVKTVIAKPQYRPKRTTMKSDTTKGLSKGIRIDESEIRGHLDKMVKGTVEETLNALLDA